MTNSQERRRKPTEPQPAPKRPTTARNTAARKTPRWAQGRSLPVIGQSPEAAPTEPVTQSDRPAWTHYRSLPPLETQETTWTCWAAAISSWSRVTAGRRAFSQSELREAYQTHDNGGLEPTCSSDDDTRCWPGVAGDLGIAFTVLRGRDLTAQMIADHLRDHGHVLLIYNLGPNASHAHVVYGVGYPEGDELRISVMDPWDSARYRNLPLSFYGDVSAMILAWPEW